MGLQDPPKRVQQDIDVDRVYSFEWTSESKYKIVYDHNRFNTQNTSTNADAKKILHLENRLAACEREKINLVEANSASEEKIQHLENRLATCEREKINQEEANSSPEEASAILTARFEQLECTLEAKETELKDERRSLARCEHDKVQMLQKVDELTAEIMKNSGVSKEALASLNGLLLIEQEDKDQIQKAAASSATNAAQKIQSLEAKLDTTKKSVGNLRIKLKETEEALVLERLLKDKAVEQVKTNETLMHAQVQKINEQTQTINNTNTRRMEEAQMAWEDPLAWEGLNRLLHEAQTAEEPPVPDAHEKVHVEGKQDGEGNSVISNPDEASECEQSSEQPQTIETRQQLVQQMEKLQLDLAAAATELDLMKQRHDQDFKKMREDLNGPEYFQKLKSGSISRSRMSQKEGVRKGKHEDRAMILSGKCP